MKRSAILATLLAVVLALLLTSAAALAAGEKQNPTPGQDPLALAPNLSFPVVMTTHLGQFYEWVVVGTETLEDGTTIDVYNWVALDPPVESFTQQYTGSFPGMSDFFYGAWVPGDDPATTDVTEDCHWVTMPMLTFLNDNKPWYPQPTDKYTNTWQAEWVLWEKTFAPDDPNYFWDMVLIDFVDWGNPLENINPTVGYRFPVEVALYTKLDETMTAYKMACLEYQSTRDELFGTSKLGGDSFTWESYYATVLTDDFQAWVVDPNGVRTDIVLEPAAGPSGKMNFASAGGGWMPRMPGWHRIYLQIDDENIWLRDAIVNNDEHYCMACGLMCEELSWQKLQLTGVFYNQTWIDVYVVPQGGKRPK